MESKNYITINGKQFILYSGLLEIAHKIGIQNLEVEIIQIPNQENQMTCICRATAVSKNGDTFIDYGDASPQNTSSKIVPHLIRMASTRAKARTLRDMCCISVTSFEELNPDDVVNEDLPTKSNYAC